MKEFFKIVGWIALSCVGLLIFYAAPEEWQRAVGYVIGFVFVGWLVRNTVKDAVREAMASDIDKLKQRAYTAEESLKTVERQNRTIIEWLRRAGYGPDRTL